MSWRRRGGGGEQGEGEEGGCRRRFVAARIKQNIISECLEPRRKIFAQRDKSSHAS